MIVLIVGPSGAGKTSSYQLVKHSFRDCVFDHLDGIASRYAMKHSLIAEESVGQLRDKIDDNDLFLAFGLEAVGDFCANSSRRHCVIDVGAGFQDATAAAILNRIHPTIAMVGDARELHHRCLAEKGDRRPFDKYQRSEFSAHRQEVYQRANHIIDTTGITVHESALRLSEVIWKIISPVDEAAR